MAAAGLKKFKMGKVLGQGTCASVFECTDITQPASGPYAMKVIDKSRSRGQEHHIVAEIKLLTSIKHPNIVKLYDVFDTAERLYLQMELIKGGELFDRIVAKGFYTESDAQKVMKQILQAIAYLHSNNIVVPPYNIAIMTSADNLHSIGI